MNDFVTSTELVKELTYSTITHNVKINATPVYSPIESEPHKHHYVWHYHIHIENNSPERLQLLKRHWIIISANGHVKEVHGSGVLGVQPILNPHEGFEYSSETSLITPSGLMVGKYDMAKDDGSIIQVDVPAFSLDSPYSLALKN